MASSSSEDFWSDGDLSDDDLELLFAIKRRKTTPIQRGSRPGRSANILREFENAHDTLMRCYFNENALYSHELFRRRYRMSSSLFERIKNGVERVDPYFHQKPDACGRMGISSTVKITLALRLLAYGSASDQYDEFLQVSESTANVVLERFCDAIYKEYGHEYLQRYPSPSEIQQYQELNSLRGWPGLFGGIDCMHWRWQNCPIALRGQYQDRDGFASLILEAVCSPELRIWNFNFGNAGSNNDINVIDKSNLIPEILKGKFESPEYEINGTKYKHPYFHTDGIYPDLAIFAKTISNPANAKESFYAMKQESTRKDIERCFGLLQAKWHILVKPSRKWSTKLMIKIMRCCVILHNMILEDDNAIEHCREMWRSDIDAVQRNGNEFACEHFENPFKAITSDGNSIAAAFKALEDVDSNLKLQKDLVEHLWNVRGALRK